MEGLDEMEDFLLNLKYKWKCKPYSNKWRQRGKKIWKEQGKVYLCFFFQPPKADFHAGFDVVFVDPSGYLNLCAGMTGAQYKRVSE